MAVDRSRMGGWMRILAAFLLGLVACGHRHVPESPQPGPDRRLQPAFALTLPGEEIDHTGALTTLDRETGLSAFRVGERLWVIDPQQRRVVAHFELEVPIEHVLMDSDQQLYAISRSERSLVALDLHSGKQRWHIDTRPELTGEVSDAAGGQLRSRLPNEIDRDLPDGYYRLQRSPLFASETQAMGGLLFACHRERRRSDRAARRERCAEHERDFLRSGRGA
jgi:hypothetical protein